MYKRLDYAHGELSSRKFSTLFASWDDLKIEKLVEQFERNQRVSLGIIKRDGATIVVELSGKLFMHNDCLGLALC